MKRKNSDIKQNPSFEEKRAYKGSNYTGDPRLVPRVKQYLEANKNKAMISVAVMAEDIQTMYSRDYGRKKKNAFKISVEKAYEYVRASTKRHSSNKEKVYSKSEKRYLQKKQRLLDSESIDTLSDSDTNDDDDDDDDKSFSSDNPDYVIQPDGNSLNDCLKNMYKKTPLKSDSAGCHSSQSSAGWMSEKHVAESGSKSNSLFVIDRRGDKSDEIPRSPGRAASSSVIKRTKKKQFTEKESVSSCSSPVNGSRSGTPSRRVTDAKNITNIQDEDPELIILDAGSTISEEVDCTCADADVDQLRDDLSNASDGMRSLLSQNQQGVLTETTDRTKNEFNISQVQHRSIHNHKVGNDNADTKINISKRKDTRQKKSKKGKTSAHVSPKHDTEVHKSTVKFADIGGNDNTLKEICKLLVHMKHPEVYERLGITPPRGFLLHGPPGCGKTLMAHAIAGELDLPFIKVAATELISGVSGESEEKIRDIFDRATSMAPCILFIDEVDAITPKRETASKDMERRVVSQLLTCMDDLNQKQGGHVLVLGATNRPDSLDPALRRAGRFDREISLGIPDQDARLKILQVLCKDLRLEEQFDFKHLSCLTPGFVGADLMALTREAAITAVNRVFQKLQSDGGSSLITNTDCDKSSEETGDNDNDKICVPQPSDSHQVIDLEQQSEMSSMYDDLTTDNGDVIIDVTSAADSSMDDRKSNSDSKTVSNSPPVRKTVKPDDELRGNSSAASESATQTDECSNFKSVLSWLKNYPPLTDKQLDDLFITMDDFKEALNHVQPSAKREGFATIPDVTWDDVGALKSVRQELQMAIMVPVQHPEQFKALGLTSAPGILLAGPPGCGKTLLAKAIANESGINFISVKGPELLNMYVGESERAVRQVFQRAKNSAPCVIFFDELDALCPRRSGASENGASVRVVNQLLTEMDGLETRKQVFIMAATNRPDIIDPAILRPGRLDKVLYVGIPDIEDRLDILTTITKNGTKPLFAPDVNLRALAEDKRCEGYTGADLAALVREAAVTALRCFMSQSSTTDTQSLTVTQPVTVTSSHFDVAFHKVRPSVSEKDQLLYTKMKAQSTPADVQ